MKEQSKTLRDIVNGNAPVEIDVFKYGKNSRERWAFNAFYRGGDAISAAGYSFLMIY